jgi:diguanylate cyclase (GGDEF)-like protein/PAS domain S-box-containing protein
MLLRRIALQEATERRLRDIFDLNPDAMGISRLEDGHYIDVNQGFTELTGYARDEVVGRTTGEIGLWADPYDREKVVAQLREGGQIRNREIRMCHKDGSVRTTLASARVVMLNGEPHIIFNTRDVSEFREVENELSKLSQAVTQSPAAIVITDRDGRIEYVNPKFVQVTGYAAAEAIGQNPRILKSGLNPPETYKELWETLAIGREWRGEILNRRKDGKLFWEYASIAPIKGANSAVIGYVAVKEDITQRKLAEKELRASEERFYRLVQSSVLGIAIDRDGVPLYANRTFAEIFGYGDSKEIVALASLNTLYAEPELDRISSYRKTCLRGWGAPKEYEFRGVKKDGSLIWIRAHLNTVTWTGEAAVQWTILDITLHKSYEQRLYRQANFDATTGLPNRTLALDRLQDALTTARRRHTSLAILFIDIDHFKKINDTLGHAQGDLFLKLVGERMKACVRETDTVARMGGDEFVVILPDFHDTQDIASALKTATIRKHCCETPMPHCTAPRKRGGTRSASLTESSLKRPRNASVWSVICAALSRERNFGSPTSLWLTFVPGALLAPRCYCAGATSRWGKSKPTISSHSLKAPG